MRSNENISFTLDQFYELMPRIYHGTVTSEIDPPHVRFRLRSKNSKGELKEGVQSLLSWPKEQIIKSEIIFVFKTALNLRLPVFPPTKISF